MIDGMFIGVDDPHSLRTGRKRDGPLLVVLGPKFDTGHEEMSRSAFSNSKPGRGAHSPLGTEASAMGDEDSDTVDPRPLRG